MTLRDDLLAHVAAALDPGHPLASYRGADWWQLYEFEEQVFGITLAEMPGLVEVWSMFEAIADVADNDFAGSALCLAAQSALPFIRPGHLDPEAWSRFARSMGIPARLAVAWYWKQHFWTERASQFERPDPDIAPRPRPEGDDDIPF